MVYQILTMTHQTFFCTWHFLHDLMSVAYINTPCQPSFNKSTFSDRGQCPPPTQGRVAVLDSHSHGKFEPSDVESGRIPVGLAEDYTISTHDFIMPAYHVHHFNMTRSPPPTHVQDFLLCLPIFQWWVISFQGPLQFSVSLDQYEAVHRTLSMLHLKNGLKTGTFFM